MSSFLCVHMNTVYLLWYLHFATGLLEESDLDVVTSELDAVSSKWYTLGKALIFTDDLKSIHTQHPQNPTIGLRKVISERMGYPFGFTWSEILAGLRSLGDSQLADHLETKYCSSELTTT